MARKRSLQEQVANLMEMDDYYANAQDTIQYGEGTEEDAVDTVARGGQRTDQPPGQEPETTVVRSCSAANCRHNQDGSRCTLSIVNISDTGGCTEYEPCADEYENDDASTIAGISTMIPNTPDHPSSQGNMVGKYLPDMIQ